MFSASDFPIKVGDIVGHVKDVEARGVVTSIDMNIPHPTTCLIQWTDHVEPDVQFTNKVFLVK